MQVAKQLPKLCVRFHEDVQRLSADFLAQQRRHYYVTPTSYLELLTSYKKLLAKKQDEVTSLAATARSWLACATTAAHALHRLLLVPSLFTRTRKIASLPQCTGSHVAYILTQDASALTMYVGCML